MPVGCLCWAWWYWCCTIACWRGVSCWHWEFGACCWGSGQLCALHSMYVYNYIYICIVFVRVVQQLLPGHQPWELPQLRCLAVIGLLWPQSCQRYFIADHSHMMLPTRYPQPVLLHHLWWRQLWEILQLRCLVSIDLLWPPSSHFCIIIFVCAYWLCVNSTWGVLVVIVFFVFVFLGWTMLWLHNMHCTSSCDVVCQVPTTEAAASMADAPMVAAALDKDRVYRCSDLNWERACMLISVLNWQVLLTGTCSLILDARALHLHLCSQCLPKPPLDSLDPCCMLHICNVLQSYKPTGSELLSMSRLP